MRVRACGGGAALRARPHRGTRTHARNKMTGNARLTTHPRAARDSVPLPHAGAREARTRASLAGGLCACSHIIRWVPALPYPSPTLHLPPLPTPRPCYPTHQRHRPESTKRPILSLPPKSNQRCPQPLPKMIFPRPTRRPAGMRRGVPAGRASCGRDTPHRVSSPSNSMIPLAPRACGRVYGCWRGGGLLMGWWGW